MALLHLHGVSATLNWLRARLPMDARLTTDSRQLRPGDAFIAWPGYATDGRRYVSQALQAGAAACLVEADGVDGFGFDDPRIAALSGLKALTGELADAWFEHPSRALDVVAVTGTNGKTSTAWWTSQALGLLGRRCGVIGTLGVGEAPSAAAPQAAVTFTGLTTPDPMTVHGTLRRLADDGFAACAMEASSIGIVEHRLAGVHVAVALFTNFTRDHLDYHHTMEAYWQAKSALFDWPGLRSAVVNLDDARGHELADRLAGRPLDLWTYGIGTPARLQARSLRHRDGGLAFEVVEQGGASVALQSSLIGEYNVSNLLAVIGGLRALGVPLDAAAEACARLGAVPGRMQRVNTAASAREPVVVVDYAHTPDALDKALAALRPLAQARGGRLWCVFGCGGNRDATKRPLMGAVAERLADQVVVTSDNPRLEDPATIIDQIMQGVGERGRVLLQADRREAIREAVRQAAAADVLLIAGKGHEDYQDIAGVKHPFSDISEAQDALVQRLSDPSAGART